MALLYKRFKTQQQADNTIHEIWLDSMASVSAHQRLNLFHG